MALLARARRHRTFHTEHLVVIGAVAVGALDAVARVRTHVPLLEQAGLALRVAADAGVGPFHVGYDDGSLRLGLAATAGQ